jgi:uncharacterized protein
MNDIDHERYSTVERPAEIDTAALIAQGWQPTPIQTFVLKIHSRCNLRCDYCYVYRAADQGWRDQPRIMSRTTLDYTAMRIAEHVTAHDLDAIELVLHGGEPLLAGPELIAAAVTKVRAAVAGHARVTASMQTNGSRLTADLLPLLAELNVGIGISLDGTGDLHDRHRRWPDGQGSYAAVSAALEGLITSPYSRLFSGLLCTIDLRNEPLATYEGLLQFLPPLMDFLLPHGNWSAPPPRRVPGESTHPYADWLIATFDRWYSAPVKETGVRLFEEIINLLLGGSSKSEDVGISPTGVMVIETNGAIEQSDMLKIAYQGAATTRMHVAGDSIDDALLTPGIVARQLGIRGLSASCQACPIGRICGGGLYPHRYSRGAGFANPSVYCTDLFRLISYIRDRLAGDVFALRGKVS